MSIKRQKLHQDQNVQALHPEPEDNIKRGGASKGRKKGHGPITIQNRMSTSNINIQVGEQIVAKKRGSKRGRLKAKQVEEVVEEKDLFMDDESLNKEEPSLEELKEIEQELSEDLAALENLDNEVEVPRDDVLEGSYEEHSAESAIKLYLREIGKVKLLTPEEEIELAERIKKGDQEARERMIKANLRLVVKIAHDYEGLGLPLLDLISEGNIGLMKAVDRFDPKKGGKLSTYAAWWIKQSIKRALANQTRAIRLPVHLVDKISRMRRIAMKLQEVLGREPTDEELADELGTTPYKIAQLKMAAVRPTSLESPIGDEDSKTYGEVVKDERAEDPGETLVEKTAKELVEQLMKKLDERERRILKYRFGLDDADEKTLEELGREMGVTRERIRQIQNQALAKLRRELEKLEKTKIW